MTTPNTEIGAIMTGGGECPGVEGSAADVQAGRALMIALDIEPFAVEANRLLQGLAILSQAVRARLRRRSDAADDGEGSPMRER